MLALCAAAQCCQSFVPSSTDIKREMGYLSICDGIISGGGDAGLMSFLEGRGATVGVDAIWYAIFVNVTTPSDTYKNCLDMPPLAASLLARNDKTICGYEL